MNKVRRIQDATCAMFGVHRDIILAPNASRSVTLARQLAMHLCRKYTTQSFPQLGQKFKRDHTTIMFGCRQAERMLETPIYALAAQAIVDQLGLKEPKATDTEDVMRMAWQQQARYATQRESVHTISGSLSSAHGDTAVNSCRPKAEEAA